MNAQDLFNGPAMKLPRDRDEEDFERYLEDLLEAYLHVVKTLDSRCHLCVRIQGAEAEIAKLSQWIRNGVRKYLAGTPEAAYEELLKGINFVYPRMYNLFSLEVGPDKVEHLYRMVDTKGARVPKERLFHAPFNLRHKVGQHRFGIPGFPCLYLGGSLELCKEELRIQAAALPGVTVAEFALRRKVKFLDFGYRPSALAGIVAGSAMRKPGENPGLEDFIVHYATCWPLIAASSIKVLHDDHPFVYEYIIPQMILQWAMSNAECDGIRYFSTRFTPGPETIVKTANYVFPATHDSGPQTGYSQRLKDTFEFTDPVVWGSLKNCNLRLEALNKERELNALDKAPL
ncbi:MAG: RES domain-containing protein [Terriglobia bacterium]